MMRASLHLPPPTLSDYVAPNPEERLGRLFWAAQEVYECHRVLHRAERNIVTEILHDAAEQPSMMAHYPENDIKDPDSGSLYFYHSHRTENEHGHFHCFVTVDDPKTQTPEPVHVGAISMSAHGLPLALFATNQWVTDEYWLPAEQTIALLDRFVIDHAAPSWPVNRWISALFILFRPHFEALLRHRDTVLAGWQQCHPDQVVLSDERVEITGRLDLNVGEWMQEIEAAVHARRLI